MKKWIAIVCTVCMAVLMVACGGSEKKEYDINQVLSALETANPVGDSRAVSEDDMNLAMNIPAELYQEFAGSIGTDELTGAMNLVVKAADGKAGEVKTALETYRANLVSVREPYAPDAAAVLKEGRIEVKGDYVVLALAASQDAYSAVDTAIADAFK